MKPKLEDVLFLNHVPTTDTKETKLLKLSNALDKKQSNSNFRKYWNEMNSSSKYLNKKVTEEAMEQMIIDDLKGQYYPGFVKYFKSNYKDSLDQSMKSAQKSVQARVKANELFAKESHDIKAHENIWKMYCNSVAFAPLGSKELVLAYECRSNLLLHFKKYADCAKDIDRALNITNFALLKVKLLCRKMTCFVAIGKDINEKKDLWLSIKDEFEKISSPLKDDKFLKMVKQAKCDSSSQPIKVTESAKESSLPLTSFPNIALVVNKEIHIVANKDFLPGEEVIVAKPIVTSANPDKNYAYCSHCLSFMWAGIPCDECSLCMYCSEECKAEAWEKYHILECTILPHINFDDTIYFELQTTLKMFLLGLIEFGSISRLKEEIEKLKDNFKLLKNDQLLDSQFLNYYIQPIKYGNDIEILVPHAKNACFLIAYMIETCDIFNQYKLLKGKELSKNKDIVFCGLLMLKLLLLCSSKANYAEQNYTNRLPCPDNRCQIKGCFKRCCFKGNVIHPFQRMFEQSCNPNVAYFWTEDGRMVYLCVQPIKKSEKIVDCYAVEFFKGDLNTRDMTGDFLRICDCDPCSKDWPLMNELYKKFKQRQLKSERKEAKIVQKYLEKNDMKEKLIEEYWTLNELEFQKLAEDVNEIVKAYGQPSFASSFLILILCTSYEKLRGSIPLQSQIPTDC